MKKAKKYGSRPKLSLNPKDTGVFNIDSWSSYVENMISEAIESKQPIAPTMFSYLSGYPTNYSNIKILDLSPNDLFEYYHNLVLTEFYQCLNKLIIVLPVNILRSNKTLIVDPGCKDPEFILIIAETNDMQQVTVLRSKSKGMVAIDVDEAIADFGDMPKIITGRNIN